MQELHKQRGIIFDLDGTLYANEDFQWQFVSGFIGFIAGRLNVDYDKAEVLISDIRDKLEAELGYPASEYLILDELGIDINSWLFFTEETIRPEDYIHYDDKLVRTFKLANARVWVDVATNTSFRLAIRILKCLGILDQVDGLWAPKPEVKINCWKPSLEIYKRIAATRRLPTSRFLVLGDRWYIDLLNIEKIHMQGKLVQGPKETEVAVLQFLGEDTLPHFGPNLGA
jgi:FMN phosphatase YigB (HAD superfamily)